MAKRISSIVSADGVLTSLFAAVMTSPIIFGGARLSIVLSQTRRSELPLLKGLFLCGSHVRDPGQGRHPSRSAALDLRRQNPPDQQRLIIVSAAGRGGGAWARRSTDDVQSLQFEQSSQASGSFQSLCSVCVCVCVCVFCVSLQCACLCALCVNLPAVSLQRQQHHLPSADAGTGNVQRPRARGRGGDVHAHLLLAVRPAGLRA